MNRFIILGHHAVTTGDFSLNDLGGGAGWLDTLARCVSNAFTLSYGKRKDSDVYLVLMGGKDAPKTIRFYGKELRSLPTNERSVSGMIKAALERKPEGISWIRSTHGVYVSRLSFEQDLSMLSKKGCKFIYLREGGTDVREFEFPEEPCFILGDHIDPTEKEEMVMSRFSTKKMTVGPRSYHADHCITIILNELDRRVSSIDE